MRSLAIAVLSVVLITPVLRAQAGPELKEPVRQELQRLQGGWRVESLETSGEKTPADDLKERIVFIGADAFLIKDGKKVLQLAKLKLDPSRALKTVNAVILQGANKGEVMLGIYELKGDTLRFCFDMEGQNRPTEFKAAAKSGLTLVVCKRIPALDKDLPKITGVYKSESPDQEGNPQTTEATIERHGDAYLVTYRKDGMIAYVGIATRNGNIFSMCWATSAGQVGLSVYQIEKGPRLVGQYTMLGGVGMFAQETLTAKHKSD